MKSNNQKKEVHYLTKKGQEEIMGFILVLVLIIVIGMFFMFMLKPKNQTQVQQSMQVENLLASIKHVNAACDVEMQEVTNMCLNDEMCGSSDACEYLQGEFRTLIETAIDKAGLGTVVGYDFTITEIDINIKQGNVTINSMTAKSSLQGEMEMQLTFYFP